MQHLSRYRPEEPAPTQNAEPTVKPEGDDVSQDSKKKQGEVQQLQEEFPFPWKKQE
ncbi:MAG: hypothetical protein LBS78_00920 [Endomicrobium sp.]|nr:hypothetical protein [Endomicrobium sp.]